MTKKIFSGYNSKAMWYYINAVKKQDAQDALYVLGCACQELEDIISSLEKRVEKLEENTAPECER